MLINNLRKNYYNEAIKFVSNNTRVFLLKSYVEDLIIKRIG